MVGVYLPRSPVEPGRPPTTFAFGLGSSGVALGVEYGTCRPGVRRVIEMAKVDCSGLVAPGGTFAGGTGMYDVMRWNLDCFWIECSANGPLGVWMETACEEGAQVSNVSHGAAWKKRLTKPRKQGMTVERARAGATASRYGDEAEEERPLGGSEIDCTSLP
jgi:hypothetical protein